MKKKKLYIAIMWALIGVTTGEAQSAVDTFNASVGVIGSQTAAPDTDNKTVLDNSATKSKLWSYQPVKVLAQPAVNNPNWVRTPIDAFVLASLEAKGLTPSPDTDRASYIRRATLDTWGLIPTPDEVASFVNDAAPDAYEKLADRLLASPRYGERQARRWLDLARYSDSAGFTGDTTRPNMWRYRDYVINAFNQDKPYSRFIQEQIAGDELAPDNQDAVIATGFLRNYPDDDFSRLIPERKYISTTDITDTVGGVFLGQTVGCARCHNHKFDKISQKDYFSLQAFFANLSASDGIPAAKGAQEIEYRNQLAKWEDASKETRTKLKELIDPIRQEATDYFRQRYQKDVQLTLNKPRQEWNAHDRWVNHWFAEAFSEASLREWLQDTATDKNAPGYNEKNPERYKQYLALQTELKKYDNLKPNGSDTISAISELGHADAPSTHVLFGGILDRPLEEVHPAFPEVLTSEKPNIVPTAFSSGRRTALANWIASEKNPLTARVFVNRIWEQYFGRGIVETVSDFGKAGAKPSNPELLDYLADSFVKNNWSVKKLHRQILLSSVYRQSSAYREDIYKADPENKLLAVFPHKRLEAEEIRDSILVASGKLEEKLGGPSVFPPIPKNLSVGDKWSASKDPKDQNRRSLYIFTRSSVPYPLLQPFDPASAQLVHHKREVTTTPLQALTLLNSDEVRDWSQALAGRVISEAGNNESAQLDRLYQILFSRTPDDTERGALQAFLNNQEQVIKEKALTGKFSIAVPTGLKDIQTLNPVRAAAFVDLVHTVVNSNDFSYRF